MRDYLLSGEWVRFAFVLGIAVSMVMYERRHLTTGSIVVPGYIAVFIIHPLVIVATFVNALLTYAFVNRFLSRHFLLYGRTKFTVLAVTSTAIQTVMLRLSPSGTWLWEMDIPFFTGVGYIVPALIAHDMARQGIKKTARSVMIAGFIVMIPIAVALLLDLPGVNDLSPVTGFGSTAISVSWLPLAIVLSVIASWAVAHNYGLRSGGFIGAAFVGMFMADPLQVVVAAIIATLTYLIVAKYLMRHMILFGRRKFSSMLLVSSSIAWSGLWLGDRFLPVEWEQRLGVGSLALTPLMLPGLLANDAQRTSPSSVIRGLVLAGTFAVTTTWWVESVVEGISLHPIWKVLSVVATVVLYKKQLVSLVRGRSSDSEAEAEDLHDDAMLETTEPVASRPVFLPPVSIEPSITEPSLVEPSTAEPVTVEPVTAEPSVVEPVEPEPAVLEPAAASVVLEPVAAESVLTDPLDVAGLDVPASLVVTDWDEWAEKNPEAADDAARWLDEQLAELTGSRPPDGQHTPTGSAPFDFDTGAVLEDALIADRGMRPVPRGSATGAIASLAELTISETSDATREAQLVASDVSDNQ